MINSIGLPNRGLAGYLEHDLPALATLAVPLITNVMGSTAEEFAELVEARRRARARRRDRAERLLPERRDRPGHRRRPARARGAAAPRAPAQRQAADRQAHAEHRRRRGVRGGRAGRRRGRGLADQHAARACAGARTAPGPGSAAAAAGSRGRRSARSRSRRSRWSRARVAIPIVGMGGVASGARRARSARCGGHAGRGRHRELPRSGRRSADRGRTRAALSRKLRDDRGAAAASSRHCKQKHLQSGGNGSSELNARSTSTRG